jgi:hypothetical protein
MVRIGRAAPPPRVLLILPHHWHRALLRAQLREVGYDAVGASDLAEALAYDATEPGRGAVRLVVVDQSALLGLDSGVLSKLLERHGRPPSVLIQSAGLSRLAGRWQHVLHRPVSIASIVDCVRTLLPLEPAEIHPVD